MKQRKLLVSVCLLLVLASAAPAVLACGGGIAPPSPAAPQLRMYFPQDQVLLVSNHGEESVFLRTQYIYGDASALGNLGPGTYDFALAPKDASTPPVFQGTVTLLPGTGEVELWFPLHNAEPGIFGWGYVSGAPE